MERNQDHTNNLIPVAPEKARAAARWENRKHRKDGKSRQRKEVAVLTPISFDDDRDLIKFLATPSYEEFYS
jgi:hypothetical protein